MQKIKQLYAIAGNGGIANDAVTVDINVKDIEKKEKIDEMLKSKKELADLAVYEGEKIITELSDEEIYEIFSLTAG